MDKNEQIRRIDVLIFDGANILDIAGPVQAFSSARRGGQPLYRHRYVSPDGGPVRTSCGLQLLAEEAVSSGSPALDLLIPGGEGVNDLLDHAGLAEVIRAWPARREGRLISICSGSLLLAAAGVLEGRAATSHWSRAEFAREAFPKVKWELDRIYTTSPRIYTSAGVSAGIDLALAIIRQDHGAAAALEVAQELVVYLRRTGGQSQFSDLLKAQFALEDPLSLLVEKIFAHPERDWQLEAMAAEVNMSSRTLSRKFRRSLNASPVQFVEQVRVRHARSLLNRGVAVKKVAVLSGFGDVQRMRRHFKRGLGVSIADYLRHFAEA